MPSHEDGCLYELLGVAKSATQAEIKKAYQQKALKLHPDKNPGDEEAHSRFQNLQDIYQVLGDPERRKLYDETGIMTDDLSSVNMSDLKSFFKSFFPPVTTQSLDAVFDKYRGSEEEIHDVLQTYTSMQGKMKKVFDRVICCDEQVDSHRFMDMIEEAIEQGKVERFKAFTAWSTKVKSLPRPADPLRKRCSEEALAAQDKRVLAVKRPKPNEPEFPGGPTEEEFQALQAKLLAKKQPKQGAQAGAKKGSKSK